MNLLVVGLVLTPLPFLNVVQHKEEYFYNKHDLGNKKYLNNKDSNFNYSQLSDYQICLIGCFFLSLFPFLPTQDFFNNWINVIFFLPVGFFLQSVYKSSNLKV